MKLARMADLITVICIATFAASSHEMSPEYKKCLEDIFPQGRKECKKNYRQACIKDSDGSYRVWEGSDTGGCSPFELYQCLAQENGQPIPEIVKNVKCRKRSRRS